MIEIKGSELNQWDTGRGVIVTGIEAEYVHFANQGDSKAVIMGLVDIDATIPDFLLQTGKPLCVYAVRDGVTLESRIFSVKKRPRPENYVYEDDQRNYIYKLITNAENAVEDATAAAKGANAAAEQASKASAGATVATGNANAATENANLAAKSANEAAAKAAHTAKSLMVVGTASGEAIVLDDAIDQYLVGCRVFGKTTQDGTPTPDAPVDLGSVENPTIEVNEQAMLVPYTLHGIPVSSGGNYTDANGQQWICDEIDFARSVYVQRLSVKTFTGNEAYEDHISTVNYVTSPLAHKNYSPAKCTHSTFQDSTVSWANSTYIRFRPSYFNVSTVSEFRAFLKEQYEVGTPVSILYILAAPIEAPLSEEELAAYATLHTSRYGTTVTNDQNAYMEIQYVMDAKKYIDSVIGTGGASAGIINATVE